MFLGLEVVGVRVWGLGARSQGLGPRGCRALEKTGVAVHGGDIVGSGGSEICGLGQFGVKISRNDSRSWDMGQWGRLVVEFLEQYVLLRRKDRAVQTFGVYFHFADLQAPKSRTFSGG